MSDLTHHYRDLLGLDQSWIVDDVELDVSSSQVLIRVSHARGQLHCPECGQGCPRADTAPERSWRHLDTMQFATEIRAAVPRCRCPQCGVKTIQVPWASKHSRFTLMFEAFAIRVIQASANVKKAAELLGLSWDATHRIMEAAVERGLDRRKAEPVPNIGIDEKSFAKGQISISVMTDIDGSRVLEVAPERTIVAGDSLWKSLTFEQLSSVESVALDMWPAFHDRHDE